MKKLKRYFINTIYFVYALWFKTFIDRKATHYFFYSPKQRELRGDNRYISVYSFLDTYPLMHRRPRVFFKGQEYTEMRRFKHGWSNWDDAVLVGIGGNKDISYGGGR